MAVAAFICTCAALVTAQSDRRKIDFSAKMDIVIGKEDNIAGDQRLFHGKGDLAPHVRVKFSAERFRGILLNTLPKGVDAAEFVASFEKLVMAKKGEWTSLSRGFKVLNGSKTQIDSLRTKYDEGIIEIVVPDTQSYNDSYTLEFGLRELLDEKPLEDVVLYQDELRYTGRASFEIAPKVGREEVDLITGNVNATSGKWELDKKTPYAVGIKGSYAGAANPLQGHHFIKERSFYTLSIDSLVSEFALDSRSNIEVKFSGVTDLYQLGGIMPFVNVVASTSQSLYQNTVFYEAGWRLGDKRTNKWGFFSESECLEQVYFEFGIQVGRTFYKKLERLEIQDFAPTFLLRPRVTLGFNELLARRNLKEGETPSAAHLASLALTGNVTAYGVNGNVGGSKDFSGIAFTFDLAISLGPDSRKLSFGVTGGQNPSQGFVRLKPVYTVGYKIKY